MAEVKLRNVRIAFCDSLFEKKQVNGEGEPRHSACFILDPKSPDVAAISKAIGEVAAEKWKDKAKGVVEKLVADNRVCFIKKPKTNKEGEVYDGFEGSFSISASNKSRVSVFDRDPKSPQLTAQDGKPYAGCYVNAILDIWAQDNQWGRRINATLTGVQFVKDGDAFTATKAASADNFDDLGVDESADGSSII